MEAASAESPFSSACIRVAFSASTSLRDMVYLLDSRGGHGGSRPHGEQGPSIPGRAKGLPLNVAHPRRHTRPALGGRQLARPARAVSDSCLPAQMSLIDCSAWIRVEA